MQHLLNEKDSKMSLEQEEIKMYHNITQVQLNQKELPIWKSYAQDTIEETNTLKEHENEVFQ